MPAKKKVAEEVVEAPEELVIKPENDNDLSNTLTTLTGLTLNEAYEELDRLLPLTAYKKVGGTSADLTDIGTGPTLDVLNRVFGLCGVGWHFEAVVSEPTVKDGWFTTLCDIKVQYQYLDIDGVAMTSFPIPGFGAHANKKVEWSRSGAVTNAIGSAVSKLGFQRSVYSGLRSHVTVAAETRAVQETEKAQKKAAVAEKTIDEIISGVNARITKKGLNPDDYKKLCLERFSVDDMTTLEPGQLHEVYTEFMKDGN